MTRYRGSSWFASLFLVPSEINLLRFRVRTELPPAQARVILGLLCLPEDPISYAVVAEALQIHIGTVHTHMRRVRVRYPDLYLESWRNAADNSMRDTRWSSRAAVNGRCVGDVGAMRRGIGRSTADGLGTRSRAVGRSCRFGKSRARVWCETVRSVPGTTAKAASPMSDATQAVMPLVYPRRIARRADRERIYTEAVRTLCASATTISPRCGRSIGLSGRSAFGSTECARGSARNMLVARCRGDGVRAAASRRRAS